MHAALVQIQQMKVFANASLLQLDRILQANGGSGGLGVAFESVVVVVVAEINLQLLAAIPVVVLTVLGVVGTRQVRHKARQRALASMDQHLRNVERLLVQSCNAQGLSLWQHGTLLLSLYNIEAALPRLSPAAGKVLHGDLELLRSCHVRPRIKLAVLHRMYSCYPFLHCQLD